MTEAEFQADVLVTIAQGRTAWQGTRAALDAEGLLHRRLLGPGRSLPPGQCVNWASDGPWSMSLTRCRPPWLASGSRGQWNAGDWWRITRTLNVAQACTTRPQALTPVALGADPARMWGAGIVGDVGLVTVEGALTAGAARRMHDELQRLGLPVFAWVFDLTACLILPGALAEPLADANRPGAVIVAKRDRHEVNTACQALALSGVLQAGFADEMAAMEWAQQRARIRRQCAEAGQAPGRQH